jgi:hypothetical protein
VGSFSQSTMEKGMPGHLTTKKKTDGLLVHLSLLVVGRTVEGLQTRIPIVTTNHPRTGIER